MKKLSPLFLVVALVVTSSLPGLPALSRGDLTHISESVQPADVGTSAPTGSTYSSAGGGRDGTIIWTPPRLEALVSPGQSSTFTVTFTSKTTLDNWRLTWTPSLDAAGVTVTTVPDHSQGGIAAGSTVTVTISVAVPQDNQRGVFSGEVAVRAGNQPLQQTLKVRLRVQPPARPPELAAQLAPVRTPGPPPPHPSPVPPNLPTATPMPSGRGRPTSPNGAADIRSTCEPNELRPRLSAEEEAKVRTAAQTELDALRVNRRLPFYWGIESVWGQDDWAVIECNVRTKEDDSPVATEGRIVLARKTGDTWAIAMPGSRTYESWLSEVPESYLPLEAKRFLAKWQIVRVQGVTLQGNSSGQYRLPFQSGRVYVTQDSAAHGGPVDMVGLDSSTVVAARDGWIRAVEDGYWQCCCNSGCANCNNYIVMEHSDGEWTKYFHIAQGSAQNAKNNLNNWVTAGTVLATQSDIGWTCGSSRAGTGCSGYTGGNCGIHLHFEVRYGRYGDYRTPRFCGVPGEIVYTGQTYTVSSCDGTDTTPPDGDYTEPPNGATVGCSVWLRAWATDDRSGVREVRFNAKWSDQWRGLYTDTSSPYEYNWDLCAWGVPDGDIELGLHIIDNANNEFFCIISMPIRT